MKLQVVCVCLAAKLGTERSVAIRLCHSSRWHDKVINNFHFLLPLSLSLLPAVKSPKSEKCVVLD